MDESRDKPCCQCGSCKWYDGFGDQCMIRPDGRPNVPDCACWTPEDRKKGKVCGNGA